MTNKLLDVFEQELAVYACRVIRSTHAYVPITTKDAVAKHKRYDHVAKLTWRTGTFRGVYKCRIYQRNLD